MFGTGILYVFDLPFFIRFLGTIPPLTHCGLHMRIYPRTKDFRNAAHNLSGCTVLMAAINVLRRKLTVKMASDPSSPSKPNPPRPSSRSFLLDIVIPPKTSIVCADTASKLTSTRRHETG